VIDWLGNCKNRHEAEARPDGSRASGAQHHWIRDFVLDLAADRGTLYPNADIQVVIPVSAEPLLVTRPSGPEKDSVG
jgi:hypothetical protein